MKGIAEVVVAGIGCALTLPFAAVAFAQSGPPTQAEITNALRPTPRALAHDPQGLPIAGSAPVVGPERQYTPASTVNAPETATPGTPAAHETAPVALLPGCKVTSAEPRTALSLKWITFEFGSAQLRPEGIAVVQTLGKALNEGVPDANFIIEGHTDATGSFAYNQQLSVQRAQAVKDYLVKEMGVKPERLEAVGVSYCELANPQDPKGAENRRVVVVNKTS